MFVAAAGAEGGHESQGIGVKINQEINWKICYFND